MSYSSEVGHVRYRFLGAVKGGSVKGIEDEMSDFGVFVDASRNIKFQNVGSPETHEDAQARPCALCHD